MPRVFGHLIAKEVKTVSFDNVSFFCCGWNKKCLTANRKPMILDLETRRNASLVRVPKHRQWAKTCDPHVPLLKVVQLPNSPTQDIRRKR